MKKVIPPSRQSQKIILPGFGHARCVPGSICFSVAGESNIKHIESVYMDKKLARPPPPPSLRVTLLSKRVNLNPGSTLPPNKRCALLPLYVNSSLLFVKNCFKNSPVCVGSAWRVTLVSETTLSHTNRPLIDSGLVKRAEILRLFLCC